MSLNIYTSVSDIPSGMKYIKINDVFFNTRTQLMDDEFTKRVLDKIDKAEYVNSMFFSGRTKELGNINKNNLSTGTKVILNIHNNPNICFDVRECGNNVLKMLPLIHEGNILWENPVISYSGDKDCDIIFKGKVYNDFYELIGDLMEV